MNIKMKHLFAALIGLAIGGSAGAWAQRPPLAASECRVHQPYGVATTQTVVINICRQGYSSSYDPVAKIPKFVAYTLMPDNAVGCIARSDAFAADLSIADGAAVADYVGSGMDKGHAAPAGDMGWSVDVEHDSFLLTNMYPQHGSLNRGAWKLLETSVRGWAVQYSQSLTVYVGALYTNTNRRIGSGVVVPHSFYKIVISQSTGQVAGWLFPHTPPYPNLGTDLKRFRVPVVEIKQLSGVEFQFPENADELALDQEWAVDFGALTAAKRKKCR